MQPSRDPWGLGLGIKVVGKGIRGQEVISLAASPTGCDPHEALSVWLESRFRHEGCFVPQFGNLGHSFRGQGLGLRVWGGDFGGLGFRVQGLGVRDLGSRWRGSG